MEILKGNAFFKNDFNLESNRVPCQLFWKQTGSQLRMLCWLIHHRTSRIRILRVHLPPFSALRWDGAWICLGVDNSVTEKQWLVCALSTCTLFLVLLIFGHGILFIYLFLAVLDLRFCARAFSSCGKQGPPFIAVRGPLTIVASLVAEHRLQMRRFSSCGSRA